MKYFTFITLLFFVPNHNLMAQSVEIDDSSVTKSYLIQLNDNTLLKGEINKITPDSIFLRLEFLGDVSISKKSNFIVEIDGGSTFRGELLESSNDSLLFDLIGLTKVWIENKNIIKLTVIEWQDVGTEGFSLANQHKTRYLFSPSGYSINEGSGYYQNIFGVFNAVNYGIRDNISIGFGTEFNSLLNEGIPTLFITPKLGKKYNDNTYVAGGILVGSVSKVFADNPFIGVGYGVITKGTENRNISLALGHSFGNEDLNSPILTLNAYLRVNDKYGFVSENWLLKKNTILAYGFRKFDKKVSTDIGLVFLSFSDTSTEWTYDPDTQAYIDTGTVTDRIVVPFPYIGWVFNW